MLQQMTLPGLDSAISSPESEAGRSLPASQDGPKTASCGPARARASRSASPAKAPDTLMTGICGPTSFACYVPGGPLSGWESRLRQRLARIGSTECLMTWKASVTPAGRPLSRLVPSMGRTVEIVSGSSPREMALWVTASARDWKDTPGMAATRPDGRSRVDQLPRQVAAAMWVTPTSLAPAKDGNNEAGNLAGLVSIRAHALACWPTPTASDEKWRYSQREPAIRRIDSGKQISLECAAHGATPPGSSATTGKPGALNPAFVCWLMGFPPEWDAFAPTAMPSSRKSRPK